MIETIEWIACSERLPAYLATVLFCASDCGVRYVLQGWRDEDGQWYSSSDSEPFNVVSYWAAWPAGPRA